MFVHTTIINTGGREVPFSTPIGHEKMGCPLSFYEGVQRNNQRKQEFRGMTFHYRKILGKSRL